MAGSSARRPRESFAERRSRRAEVEDPTVVLDAALRFLEVRPRSVAEVRRRLTSAGYREDLVTNTLDRLVDLQMLDDESFARQWVESRDRARPRGERALQAELRQKGIESDTIAAVLEDRRGSETDHDVGEPLPDERAARRLLDRHANALGRVTDLRVRRQRAYALLARNGFGPDICRQAAASWLDATGDASVDRGVDQLD